MTQAIFLSYASQDADAARRICDALRAAGMEVWFDQSELRGGDAWDASIRKQIKECALFVPIISANTNSREEGYFRREWNLAVNRMLDMAEHKTFLVPVLLEGVAEPDALVPDKFRERQWSRLTDARSIAAFATRVNSLLSGEGRTDAPPDPISASTDPATSRAASTRRPKVTPVRLIAITGAIVLLVVLGIYYSRLDKSAADPGAANSTAMQSSATSTINPLSIMVMPFANQTGDTQKAYIADALTSSITDDLVRIQDAFIVSTATAYSLQDKKLTIAQLGKEAAVRFVLNGGVTSDGEKLRIRAALSDTQSGAQLWTENFDGSKADLFALQDKVTARIGNSIGQEMFIVAARDSEKRASTPKVTDLLMRTRAIDITRDSLKNNQAAVALCRQALAIEPDNIAAKARLAIGLAIQASQYDSELNLDRAARIALAKQAADLAREVNAIDPKIPVVYTAIAIHAGLTGDQQGNVQAERRRVELQPKSTGAYNALGVALLRMGDAHGAKAVLEKSLQFAFAARPPVLSYRNLSWASLILDQPDEAIAWAQKALTASPSAASYRTLALAYALKGDEKQARKAAAEAVRLNPRLRLDIADDTPWLGKEAQYRKYIETKYLPAWRLAGLPE